MKSTSLVVVIEGREALPVRAIPYVTGWQVGPGAIVKSLVEAQTPFLSELDLLSGLAVYHLTDTGFLPVTRREWEETSKHLAALEAELRERRPNLELSEDHAGEAAWLSRSVELLPAQAFVWLDELMAIYEAKRVSILQRIDELVTPAPADEDDDPEFVRAIYVDKVMDRPDSELILTPMLMPDIAKMVRQAFPETESAPVKHLKGTTVLRDQPDGPAITDREVTDDQKMTFKMLIQREATRRWRSLVAAGAKPSINDMAKDLASWCSKSGVLTARGIRPSAEYIRRHVISTRHWTPPA